MGRGSVKILTLVLFVVSSPLWAAEVIFTPAELDAMKGADGLAGADGTNIFYAGDICSASVGGVAIEWACSEVGAPPVDPPVDPPLPGWPALVPSIPFEYQQIPGQPTQSGELPSTLGTGDVLDFTGQNINGDRTLTCSGTEQAPAFVIGGLYESSDDYLEVGGSWCIFVGTVFDNTDVRTTGDHIILRDVEQRNSAGHNGVVLGGLNIVLISSEVHHNQGNDRHGIHVPSGASDIWILENYIHHNGGDGFQACHRCDASPPFNVYIARNLFHSDRENAVDFKYISNAVVSENVMHSYVPAPEGVEWCYDDGSGCGVFSSGSDGSAVVVGSDGAPTGITLVGNEIYNSENAIRVEESDGVIIRDNNLHDNFGMCLALEKSGFDLAWDNNICRDTPRGIFQFWRVNFSLNITNSVFESISGPAIEYEDDGVCGASTLIGNTFTNTGPAICENITATTEAEINALPGASANVVN